VARPRTFDEATAIKAAREQFRNTGYSGTSLADLVTATGLGKASIYNAFGDKHALYLRAFEDYCTEVVGALEQDLDGPDETARERLRNLVHHMAATSGTPSSPPMSCFLSKATAELGALDPEVAGVAQRAFQRIEDILATAVQAAQRAGVVTESRDSRSTARHILVALRGIEALSNAGVDRAILADAARSVTDLTLEATD
jgi:TetR/AcrR family transcriptional regulator, transcriptional repressor for nem operon